MGSAADKNGRRSSAVDLDDVECKVTVTRAPFGSASGAPNLTEQAGLWKVTAKAILHDVDLDEDTVDEVVIARAKAYVVDLVQVSDPLGLLDEIGSDAFHLTEDIWRAPNIIDALTLSGELEALTDRVILVESVLVEERYRGQRIGPRLLATLEDTLAGAGEGGTLVVLQAKPLQWESLSAAELDRARKKVVASYESIGFKLFRGDVYWRHSAYMGLENLDRTFE